MVNDIAVQDFVNAIKEPPTETVTSYNGVVSKIDKEGTAWVRVQGSNIETPTASSYVKVALGDKVSLNWRNNKLYIDGNYTDPSIGEGELDKVAVKIKARLKKELEEEKEEEGGEGTIVAIWQEYNMSQYRTTPFRQASGYYWSETIWPYVRGLYMWIRYVYQYSDGTIEYGEPKFDMTNQAIAEANEAATNAANAAATASGIASSALEAASEKRRVFNSQPTTPYELNDLWFDGTHGKTYLCTTARATGSFSSSDWTLYSEDVSNYFWHDSAGAHVSDTQGTVASGNSQTIASTGTVMMRNGKLVTSWTGSSSSDAALNFYDCTSASARDADLVASYARAGITQYINNKKTIALTPSALSFFDPTDGTTPEAIFGSGGVNLYSEGKLRSSLDASAQTFYATDGQTPIAEFGGSGVNLYASGANVATFGASNIALAKNSSVATIAMCNDTFEITGKYSSTDSTNDTFRAKIQNTDSQSDYRTIDIDTSSGTKGNEIKLTAGDASITATDFADYYVKEVAIAAGNTSLTVRDNDTGGTYQKCVYISPTAVVDNGLTVDNGGLIVDKGSIKSLYTYQNPASGSANCHITQNGYFRYVNSTSSKRYKHDIKEVTNKELDPHNLYDVEVVQFKYNDGIIKDETDCRYGKVLVGFIAEQVEEHYPVAVDIEDGKCETWNPRYIIPPMLALIQEQHAQIEELTKRIDALERKK